MLVVAGMFGPSVADKGGNCPALLFRRRNGREYAFQVVSADRVLSALKSCGVPIE